ncbi:hypothetical protein [Microvirga sp. Mcv34]|uniref:hypothetical protein n=1 Tax=Microvirga sp. Mcv34 TaxID=2926016 RepID=UPI0021C9C239|nr:hypothetical protein [Microvirga sp. Mcv34]
MRIFRFKSLEDAAKGSQADLVAEYRNVRFAEDHEFPSNLDRDRYARAIYTMGSFLYGHIFIRLVGAEPESPDVMIQEGRYPHRARY